MKLCVQWSFGAGFGSSEDVKEEFGFHLVKMMRLGCDEFIRDRRMRTFRDIR